MYTIFSNFGFASKLHLNENKKFLINSNPDYLKALKFTLHSARKLVKAQPQMTRSRYIIKYDRKN